MLEHLESVVTGLLIAMMVALAIASVGLALIWRSVRRLNVPTEAGFFATMHHVPLLLMVLLDLLDFGLDIFAAPVSWVILDRLGLRALRNKAALEALLPFTQTVPTFTLAWLAARLLNLRDDRVTQIIEGEAVEALRRLDEGGKPGLPHALA
ncbi:MAG: hypothetical protein N2378_18120 [Chloroflexaceae bacterium]|nr:hypothetical protein [Chloroflexaceae bacterium]